MTPQPEGAEERVKDALEWCDRIYDDPQSGWEVRAKILAAALRSKDEQLNLATELHSKALAGWIKADQALTTERTAREAAEKKYADLKKNHQEIVDAVSRSTHARAEAAEARLASALKVVEGARKLMKDGCASNIHAVSDALALHSTQEAKK